MGGDIPATLRRFGSHLRYVHFRDVRGNAEAFAETFFYGVISFAISHQIFSY
jgi:D-mannonate dehydratase